MKKQLSLFLVGSLSAGLIVAQTQVQVASQVDVSKESGLVKYEFAKVGTQTLALNEKIKSLGLADQLSPEKRKEATENSRLLDVALKEVAKSDKDSLILSASLLREYLSRRSDAKSAAQISQIADEASVEYQALLAAQNAEVISQNREMISLLQKLLAKK